VLVRCKCRIHGSFSTRETVKFHHVGIGLTQQIKHQHQYVYITKCIESFCLIIITLKQVALCVKFQLIPGKSVSSKSVHVNDGSAFLFLDGTAISSTVLHPYDENESLSQQLSKIIMDFDASQICFGLKDDKFSAIQLCAGAVRETDGRWRSTKCSSIYVTDGKTCCPSCHLVKRALGRLASKVPQLSSAEKLEKMKSEFRLAKKTFEGNKDKLAVSKT
jgi:hypothetical protein